MNPDFSFRREEAAIFRLRALYEQYGYSQYKMSKFEEYDLYVRNKSFLVSDSVITFTDTSGKLMALKPDVTLSIVKNSRYTPGALQKVYYHENVYRVAGQSKTYREIPQSGLECLGDLDTYAISEVLSLAEESLSAVASDYVLDISHMGIFSLLLSRIALPEAQNADLSEAVSHKNMHEAAAICQNAGVSEEGKEKLLLLLRSCGAPALVLPVLYELFPDAEWKNAIKSFSDVLAPLRKDRVRIDFSVINDMNYYNGIVFQGFVKGVPERILSGGQYDNLVLRMGRKGGAIGFALYLDKLQALETDRRPWDVDTLLLYGASVTPSEIRNAVEAIIADGRSVLAQREIPEKLCYRELIKLDESGVEILETNA